MRLDFLILADRAEAVNGKLYMVGGGFDRVGIPEVPGTADYDVALGFLVDYNETNERHEFQLAMQDEDGKDVIERTGGAVEVGRPPGMVPGQQQRVVIVLRGPFPAPVAGNCRWVAFLDGHPEEATRFRVDKVVLSPPGIPPAGFTPASG